MNIFNTQFALLASLLVVTSASLDSQFMVVAPRQLLVGQHEKIWISFVNRPLLPKPIVDINLINPENEEILSAVSYKYDPKISDALLEIPNTIVKRGLLEVVVRSGNETVKRSVTVDIEQSAALVFIETDKPYYKPGELVRMRFLLLQHELLPVTNGISKVWIENPSDVRMAQWQNLETSSGLTQLEMQLSEEPVQGIWKIKLQQNNVSTIVTKIFEVKEYVLPKFEVTITPPDYITENSDNAVWNICAKYSYGKPVEGKLLVNVSFVYPYYHWNDGKMESPANFRHDVIELKPKDGSCQQILVTKEEFSRHKEMHAYKIAVTASVEEAGTGEVQESSQMSDIHRDDLILKFVNCPHYSRPYLPYHGKLRVTLRNGKAVADKEVKFVLKVKKTSHSPWVNSWNLPHQDTKNFTTDADGYIDFIVPPQNGEVHTLVIEVSTMSSTHAVHESLETKQWHSPSDSYIQIVDNSTLPLECNVDHNFDIEYTVNKNQSRTIKLFYVIQSKGDIIQQVMTDEIVRESKLRLELRTSKQNKTIGKLPATVKLHPSGKWTLKIKITPLMAPTSYLLVYYIRDDGEVIAASQKLEIQPCFQHQVSAHFNHEQVQPGAEVNLAVTTSSRSYCAISGIDKAVTFLNGDNALTRQTVFQSLEKFNVGPASLDYSEYNCDSGFSGGVHPSIALPRPVGRSRRLLGHTFNFGNSKRTFQEAGMVVLTNLLIDPKPCPNLDENGDIDSKELPEWLNAGGPGRVAKFRKTKVVDDSLVSLAIPMASFDSDSVSVSSVVAPLVEIRSLFPETWLWQLEYFDGSQENKLDLKAPHSITDWVVNVACVSVVDGLGIAPPTVLKVFKPYFMDYTLPYSIKRGEVLPLKVSLYNYLNQDLPIRITFGEFTGGTLLNEPTVSMCLSEHSSLVHEFRLQPSELGVHNITVMADVDPDFPSECGSPILINARDGLVKPIIIKPEGFPEDITNSFFVCLSGNEQANIGWNLNVPDNLVEDSARAFISVIGDIMGPSLENLDGLVQLPMGCGEQNMILFVPNIVVLNYLNSTGQVNPQLRSSAMSHMKKGYQRELTYRHKDGSYSAFGESDREGSMWLTAFVVKSFAQAKKYIFIDTEDLKRSVDWINSKQLISGCFPFVGQVFHKDMKGGLDSSSSPIALTAYVLISLIESEIEIDKSIISNAVDCLLAEEKPNLYGLTLTTYALVLVNEKYGSELTKDQSEAYFHRLMKHAISERNELRFEKQGTKSLALSVEITAYAILILSKLQGEDNLLHALSAVRWISKNRNSNGGFISTQDTVVALEALAKYAVSVPNNNISLTISASTSDGWQSTFALNDNNKLVLQQQTIKTLPTYLDFYAEGGGCAVIQSNLKYNVKNASVSEAFNLSATVTPVVPGVCSQLLFAADISYTLPDHSSNMAVLEIELISGYEPVKSSLDLLKFNTNLNLKRWEDFNGHIHLYFDTISSDGISFNFLLNQAVEVESPQPSKIRVYDYYTPEQSVSSNYGLEDYGCENEAQPAAVDPLDTLQPIPLIHGALVSKQNDRVAADAPMTDKKDPFENFSNVDHDLDFPDGNEGVKPVYIPAPQPVTAALSQSQESSQQSESILSCPTCISGIPDDFENDYCPAVSVLKIKLSYNTSRIEGDFSPNKSFSKVNRTVFMEVDEICKCDALQQDDGYILVLLTSAENIEKKDQFRSIKLNEQALVVQVGFDKAATLKTIRDVRKRCKD